MTETEEDDGDSTAGPTVGSGGSGATTSAGGSTGTGSLCASDCTAIMTPPCFKSVCNEGMYPGAVGSCVVVPDEGGPCDDGQFCTIDDACDAAGMCVGTPGNDCGMTPGQCEEIACNEDTDSCGTQPAMNGAPCQDPNNLCIKGATCNNGLCIGGMLDDCFFFPVPSDCHEAVCNPINGMCEPQIGNEGGACTDPNDLCTVNKTCTQGMCTGGQAKDCSQLTQGCVLGVCDTTTGSCTTQNLMNGDPCDDLNACTAGELCNNGTCSGGTPITACTGGDNCCPTGCNEINDPDCAKEEYSHSFTTGSLSLTSPQCMDWAAFTTQLTGAFSAVTIRGSNDPVGVTCNVPSMATQLCNALNTSTVVSGLSCNGRIWNVGDCSVSLGQPFEINSRTSTGDCNCDTAYTVRPCIGNNNWGGINTATCSSPTQTMEVICFR